MRLLLLFVVLCCVCGETYATTAPWRTVAASSSTKQMGSYKNCKAQDSKGTDDNEVLYFTKADGTTLHFVCEKNSCGDDSHVAILDVACIRNGDKCYQNGWFKCSISLLDDAWGVARDVNKKEEKLELCSKAGDNYALTSVANSHKAIITPNGIYEDYYIHNVVDWRVCWAYVCDDKFILNSDKSACEKIICEDGATQQTDDCGGITNARQCTQKCVGGTRWKFQSLDLCVDNYRVENGACVVDIKAGDKCKSGDLSGLNASAGKYQNIGGDLKCVATECKSGAYKVKKDGVYHGYCMFDTCADGKKLKVDGEYTDGTCEDVVVESSPGTEEVAPVVENNTNTEKADEETETTPTGANAGGASTGGTDAQSTDVVNNAAENVPAGAPTTSPAAQPQSQSQTPESATVVETVQDDGARVASQEKIDELKDNARAMRDKEQSTANKLLGAAGIGATGIGGMMLASGAAEQSADADAEIAMRAYLATFTCNYGAGKNVRGGEMNVELPGANELIALYSEYVNLANDLKARKAALGMQPGIEFQPILDSATSGLYDDVAVGRGAGAYASLARALADPNGADAAAWAAQKQESADKTNTGAITAGVGAVGSLVGDLVINSGKCDAGKRWDDDKNKCVDKK